MTERTKLLCGISIVLSIVFTSILWYFVARPMLGKEYTSGFYLVQFLLIPLNIWLFKRRDRSSNN